MIGPLILMLIEHRAVDVQSSDIRQTVETILHGFPISYRYKTVSTYYQDLDFERKVRGERLLMEENVCTQYVFERISVLFTVELLGPIR